jgi:hypothetical protein
VVLHIDAAAHWEPELNENDALYGFQTRDIEKVAAMGGILLLEEA